MKVSDRLIMARLALYDKRKRELEAEGFSQDEANSIAFDEARALRRVPKESKCNTSAS